MGGFLTKPPTIIIINPPMRSMVPLSGSRVWPAGHTDWSRRGATLTLKSCIQLYTIRRNWPSHASLLPTFQANKYVDMLYDMCKTRGFFKHLDLWYGFKQWWFGDHRSPELHSFLSIDTDSIVSPDLLVDHEVVHDAIIYAPDTSCHQLGLDGTINHEKPDHLSDSDWSSIVVMKQRLQKLSAPVEHPSSHSNVVELDVEKVKVKQHRRVHKHHEMEYARAVLDEVRCKFGVPKRTEANMMAIRRFANGIMCKHGVRPSHCVNLLPYIVHAAFIPTEDDIRASEWLGCNAAKERLRLYHSGGAAMQS